MYCVIMAGGTGTRFWPLSRVSRSKQFLAIQGKRSLIQSTVDRISSFASGEHLYIVSKRDQQEALESQITEIPKKNFLYEPEGKNTAPCIGLAAMHVHKRNADGIMVVLPSDHLIGDKRKFKQTVLAGVQVAKEKDGLVTIGIKPNRPATGYGYIQKGGAVGTAAKIPAYYVKTFAEKPNEATAQRFIDSGDFLWNSGMFIFRISTFLKAMEEHLPDTYDSLLEVRKAIGKPNYQDVLERVYRQIRSISIDYGIMEKANNVYLLEGNFGWGDLGSWDQVYLISRKNEESNVFSGDVVSLNTRNSYVHTDGGLVALCGVEDLIVVQQDGATLICKRDASEDVKLLVDKIKKKKYEQYL